MSIPVRFHVLGPGNNILMDQTFGTISNGPDEINTQDRETWLKYLIKGVDKASEPQYVNLYPWLATDFEGICIETDERIFFLREEFMLEENRIKELNKRAYFQVKDDGISLHKDVDKWIDPE